MNHALKILLFLLLLPVLIVLGAVVILPVLIFLLVLICFMPSVRIFHHFQTRQTFRGQPPRNEPERPAAEEVIDVECTVTETTEGSGTAEGSSVKQLDTEKAKDAS